MKVLVITQARVRSTRLPNKVMLNIGTETMLSLHLKRLLRSKRADKIVVATTNEDGVEHLLQVCDGLKVPYHQGSLNDVLDRFYKTARKYQPELVVRVTSDCPLIDPELLDHVIDVAIKEDVDYCANTLTEDFPDGQDIEVFKFRALEKAWNEAKLKSEREHVTSYIRNNSKLKSGGFFTAFDVTCSKNFNAIRMTVDEPADLQTIRTLVKELGIDARWEEYVDFMLKHKSSLLNTDILRNEGYLKSISNE